MDRGFTKTLLKQMNGGARFKPHKIDEANRERRKAMDLERIERERVRELKKMGDRLRASCERGVVFEVRRILTDKALKKLGLHVDDEDDLGRTPLMYACREGKLLVVESLLMKKARLNHQSKQGNSALMEAARNGHHHVLSRLLLVDADVHAQNVDGWTALSWACAFGHIECVEALVRCGADVNHRSHKGSTPFMMAAEQGRNDVLSVMLGFASVDINDRNKYGFTALHRAADGGHVSTCRLLVSKGADTDSQDAFGSTPLHWACANGHEDVVTYLLSQGVSVKLLNRAHKTPLMLAQESRQEGVIRKMKIAASWEWDAARDKEFQSALTAVRADEDGDTAGRLHQACREADGYTVWQLCKAGADVESPAPKSGLTPLLQCAAHNCAVGVDALLAHGANVKAVNVGGTTALMVAARRGFTVIVRRLIAAGCPMDHQNRGGETALHLAAANGHTQCVSVLCLAGASENVATVATGATPMVKACIAGHLGAVKVLAKLHKRSPHVPDKHGWTPLMRAVSKGRGDVCRFLIQLGVDLLARNTNGATVDDVAKKCREGVMIRIVREEYAKQERLHREKQPGYHFNSTARSAAATLFG